MSKRGFIALMECWILRFSIPDSFWKCGWPGNLIKGGELAMSKKSARRPRVFGTGLIALDVVSESKDSKPQLFAGGTCGNVLAILSHLGWTATPIGRLDTEFAGTFVRSDLRRWGVDTSLLSLSPTARTPVIFQKIRTDR